MLKHRVRQQIILRMQITFNTKIKGILAMEIKEFTAKDVLEVLPKVNQLGYNFTVEELSTIIKTVSTRLQTGFSVEGNNHIKKLHDVNDYMAQHKDYLYERHENVFTYVTSHPKSVSEFTEELFAMLLMIDNAAYKNALIRPVNLAPFDARTLYIAGLIYPLITKLTENDMIRMRKKTPGNAPSLQQIKEYLYASGLEKMIVYFVTAFNSFGLNPYAKNVDYFLAYLSEIDKTEQDKFFELLSTYSEYRDHASESSKIITQVASMRAPLFADEIIQKFVGYVFHLKIMRTHHQTRGVLYGEQTEKNNKDAIKTLTVEYAKKLKRVPSDHHVLKYILNTDK